MPVQQRQDADKYKIKIPRRVVESDTDDPHPVEGQESWNKILKVPKFFNGTVWVSVSVGITDLSSLVTKTTKINGHSLNSDINVTLADLGITQSGSKLIFSGNTFQYEPVVERITGTTVLSDAQSVVLIDAISDCDIFLPAGTANRTYRIRNVGVGRVTFVANGANTVENVSSYLLLTTNAFDLIFYSGNWYIF